jgi:ectoine hydroxylase-related dioxygenase (phytanoyl-CoA dioxygenase family)
MNEECTSGDARRADAGDVGALSPQQLAYFETFGFLKIPGLFSHEIERLACGFDDIFARVKPDRVLGQRVYRDGQVVRSTRRSFITNFIEHSDQCRWLGDDPRIAGVVFGLLGSRYQRTSSSGHLFETDTDWHQDITEGPERMVRLAFYLDPLRDGTGALRVIPGSHHESGYVQALNNTLYGKSKAAVAEYYGVGPADLPQWVLESEPGDLLCFNYRTFHASFHTIGVRRLLTLSFRACGDEARPLVSSDDAPLQSLQ